MTTLASDEQSEPALNGEAAVEAAGREQECRKWRTFRIFDRNAAHLSRYWKVVGRIDGFAEVMAGLSEEDLREKTGELRSRVAYYFEEKRKELDERGCSSGDMQVLLRKARQTVLTEILPEAFALVKETAKRKVKKELADVQLIGGITVHDGRVAEMQTGEGKTLMAALPLYLNALAGFGVHLVTPNDYLVRTGVKETGPIFHALGMSVGLVQGHVSELEGLGKAYIFDPSASSLLDGIPAREVERAEAYNADITYVSSSEVGFDYLRDGLITDLRDRVLRDLHFAIVDEADMILIDDAKCPLIISAPASGQVSDETWRRVDNAVKGLAMGVAPQTKEERDDPNHDCNNPDIHILVDEKLRTAVLSEAGMDHIEKLLEIDKFISDMESPGVTEAYMQLLDVIDASVEAHALYVNDVHYVKQDGRVTLINEATGRFARGRRYMDRLQEAIEAKEGVTIQPEDRPADEVTYQNFYRLYDKLAGMTGTGESVAQEFQFVYGMEVVVIPTNEPVRRIDHRPIVYKTVEQKRRAAVGLLTGRHIKGQPALMGTRSIPGSEALSSRLSAKDLQKDLMVRILMKTGRERLESASFRELTKRLNRPLDTPGRIDELRQEMIDLGLKPDLTAEENLSSLISILQIPVDDPDVIRGRLVNVINNGIEHSVLNAKHDDEESLIIAEAGKEAQVMVATTMAGRGVDIMLGGKSDGSAAAVERAERVKKRGGLCVIGTESHENRRLDRQLRGRSGRQGDPGESFFLLSMEDELPRVHCRVNPFFMDRWPEEEPADSPVMAALIERAQQKVEDIHFGMRKRVLKYDNILLEQRRVIRRDRELLLQGADLHEALLGYMKRTARAFGEMAVAVRASKEKDEALAEIGKGYDELDSQFGISKYISRKELLECEERDLIPVLEEALEAAFDEKEAEIEREKGIEGRRRFENKIALQVVDYLWMDHLQDMRELREGADLGVRTNDPIVDFARNAHDLFESFKEESLETIAHNRFRFRLRLQARRREKIHRRIQARRESEGNA